MAVRPALAPAIVKDRFDVYRFFNGISVEQPRERTSRIPMVKSFLLEHVARRNGGTPRRVDEIFRRLGAETKQIDESFFSVVAEAKDEYGHPTRTTTGFVETYSERFFVYYTCEKTEVADPRVERWVQQPDLDHAWFSSPFLQAIWEQDVSQRGDARFSQLVFKHDSMFEMPEDSADSMCEEEDASSQINDPDEDAPVPERRAARFAMSDRIGRIRASLQRLQAEYEPLHVLHAIRLPSQTTTGGHDLRQDGKVTNRTESFEDHRNTLRYLHRIYASVLDNTEDLAWQREEAGIHSKMFLPRNGAPLIVQFSEPLNPATFDKLVDRAFQKRNRFKLWGNPLRMGPTKVHVYGADRHLWQPINMEITDRRIVATLPRGTCGNTFHRLVANIQHYVSPKIDAWIGGETFSSLVSKWPKKMEQDDGS